MRYPSYANGEVVFSYAGDLWKVGENGGMAMRLTSDSGLVIFPRFSQDGSQIAFSAEYDGNRDVYTIGRDGGIPKRLTYSMDVGSLPERMGPDKIIMHWTNDGKIHYRNRGDWWHAWTGKLWLQDTKGSLREPVQVPHGGFAYLSPDGKKIAYNRVFREFRTWKRYRGGQADDIWIYDFDTKELINTTNNPAQDIIPMWTESEKIYFLSDRDSRMNIYSYDISTKTTKKVTDYSDYDVKFPSLNQGIIAYSKGGELFLLDTKTDVSRKVTVKIMGDFEQMRVQPEEVSNMVAGWSVSPEGDFTAIAARGDIFAVPNTKGITRNLTKSPAAHDRDPQWSPDGKWISFISDESGEDELYVVRADGTEKKKISSDAESYRFSSIWSPDSKKLLTMDKAFNLKYYDVASGKGTLVYKSEIWEVRDVAWSPDSRWIAYIDYKPQMIGVVKVFDTQSGKTEQLTDGFYSASDVVFTPGGNYILYKSERTFKPKISDIEWNVSYSDMQKIYALPLKKSTPTLFPYEGADLKIPGEPKKEEEKNDGEVKVEIDFEGIQDREFSFPVDAANYYGLRPTKDHKLYYTKNSEGNSPAAYYFDVKTREEKKLGDFTSFQISQDGKKLLIRKGRDFFIENLATSVKPNEKVDLSNMITTVNRPEEWKQLYYETWRQMKHFFYDPNMHGVNWDKVRDDYAKLLPYVRHRSDLTFIMGEVIGELNVGHAYVGGGDMPNKKSTAVGLLGADYTFDGGAYKISKILQGRNWDSKTYAPLDQTGLDVKEGDYLISVNGIKLSDTLTPGQALVGLANDWVELEVSDSPKGNTKKIYAKTIDNEKDLRYMDWVEANRQYVEQKSGGKLGYIHIPDMGAGNGLTEFFEYWLPQLDKEGLIIDDRYNGGGNVSPMITQRLMRELDIVKMKRNQTKSSASPSGVFPGPKVLLINELSASDGDLFPYRFKANNLGTIIGKRSWGGVVGIYGPLPMIDGGYVYKPESANFGANGEWILEGVGMEPDIVVDNKPNRLLQGIDDQLEAAINFALEEIKKGDYRKLPAIPPFPDKSK
ncbi:MAG: S41 family peptidase [Candidatus Kapaibacteriales bacterium]